MNHIPTTPFSTPLSRSARETELRIRSILQWKKQRPPVWMMTLVALTILGCFHLVSCQPMEPAEGGQSNWLPGPEIAMAVQYYDDMERIVEVPELILPENWEGDTETIDALNALFDHLEEEHGDVLTDPLNEAGSRCIFYPSETERYLNLVFYREWLTSSRNDGQITAQVYDKEHNRLMGEKEALTLAGIELDDLLYGVEEHCQAWLDSTDRPNYRPVAYSPALEGFRIRADGQPEFYLSVHGGDHPDGPSQYGVWKHLYVWADGVYTHYNCRAAATHPAPLVPVSEVLDLAEPLWCQWYFQGGESPEIKPISRRLQTRVEPNVRIEPANVRFLSAPMERLTEAQKALLADLPAEKLPREAVELSFLYRTDIWRDTLIPLAYDEAQDVTLYGVVEAASIPDTEPLVTLPPQTPESDGIVLRVGDRAAYFPLIWRDNVWSGSNPWMVVKDFDFDGQAEAAVCLFSSHGTGVKIENLFIFDLDTLTYSIPQYTGGIHVSYDPTAHTATLSSADQSTLVDIPADLWNFRYVTCGEHITFSCENGRLYCHMELAFGGMLNYLCTATFPIFHDDSGYYLGRVSQFQTY